LGAVVALEEAVSEGVASLPEGGLLGALSDAASGESAAASAILVADQVAGPPGVDGAADAGALLGHGGADGEGEEEVGELHDGKRVRWCFCLSVVGVVC